MSSSFRSRLQRKLQTLRNLQLRRELEGVHRGMGPRLRYRGREMVNFSSNDYLGLATDPRVVEAQRASALEYGAGSGGSRLVCGNHPLYRELEENLASWKDTESALVFGSGFLTNLGVISSLMGGRDAVFYDELSHRCLIDGVRLSNAEGHSFPHNRWQVLAERLEAQRDDYDAVLIVTEGIFSMDGDRCPLDRLCELRDRFDTWLLVDEAHSAGVWGPDGAGLTASGSRDVEVAMGTLSKAFGTYGGYVAGNEDLRRFLVNRAGSFVYSTGLPPAVVGGTLEALDVLRSEPDRRASLRDHVQDLARWLRDRDVPVPDPPSQIVPLLTGDTESTLRAADTMMEEGLYAVAIRYPTVPRHRGRIRISLRSDHTEADRDRLKRAVIRLGDEGLLERGTPG